MIPPVSAREAPPLALLFVPCDGLLLDTGDAVLNIPADGYQNNNRNRHIKQNTNK